MPRRSVLRARFWIAVALAATTLAETVHAQTIWSGLTKTFSKTAFSDHTLPENQDALTSRVVLTRGGSGGLINIVADSFFDQNISPMHTRWASDLNNPGKSITASNWADLSFTNWLDAHGGQQTQGAFVAGRRSVVHLVSDGIYLDFQFDSWGVRSGGGYSYMRAEPPTLPQNDGDYNRDGVIDAADYVIWRKTLGQPVANEGDGADGNESGAIDLDDYNVWRMNFGREGSAPALAASQTAAVPEPATNGLLMLAALLMLRRRPGNDYKINTRGRIIDESEF